MVDIILVFTAGFVAWKALNFWPGRWYGRRKAAYYREHPDPLFGKPD